MGKRFVVALQDEAGQTIGQVTFGSATDAADYMDYVEYQNPGYKALCSVEPVESFEAHRDRMLEQIMQIKDE